MGAHIARPCRMHAADSAVAGSERTLHGCSVLMPTSVVFFCLHCQSHSFSESVFAI